MENTYRKKILSLVQPSWMINELIRKKRNERLVEELIPTRHAKHRKRRRYKNRSTCVENTSASKLSQDNNTTPIDIHVSKEVKKNRDENNTVLEIEDELDDVTGVNDRVQVIIGDDIIK